MWPFARGAYDPLDTFAFEALAVSTTAVPFTAATLAPAAAQPAKIAIFRVEGGAIRFRLDGTAPTAGVGREADVGDTILVDGRGDIGRFQAIRRDGTDATLSVEYSR